MDRNEAALLEFEAAREDDAQLLRDADSVSESGSRAIVMYNNGIGDR